MKRGRHIERKVIRLTEFAAMVGVDRKTAYKWMECGVFLPDTCRMIGGVWYVRVVEAERVIGCPVDNV